MVYSKAEKRTILGEFKTLNFDAGVNPLITELCLTYIRFCLNRGLLISLEQIKPTPEEALQNLCTRDNKTAEQYRKLVSSVQNLGDRHVSLVSLMLWYCFNLLNNGAKPLVATEDLANEVGLSHRNLHYLATTKYPCYTDFEVPKRNGGVRKISAPCYPLLKVQRWILDNILTDVRLSPSAMAYRRAVSIVDNATPHVSAREILKVDLEDFFPTITFPRIVGIYLDLGYLYPVAILLAKLSSHNGVLPQGAPTSPALSNIACRKLDTRLTGLARVMRLCYTRYADDITFSGQRIPKGLVHTLERILNEEGFHLAHRKTKHFYAGQSKLVTGLVVNDKPNIPREYYRKLRAVIHNCVEYGPLSQNRNDVPHFREHLYGHAYYVFGINPQLGRKLLNQLDYVVWEVTTV